MWLFWLLTVLIVIGTVIGYYDSNPKKSLPQNKLAKNNK